MRVPLGSTRAKMISLLWLISWDQVINPRRVTRTYTSPSRSCLLKGGGLTSLSVLRLEAWVTTTGSSREKWEGCAPGVFLLVYFLRGIQCAGTSQQKPLLHLWSYAAFEGERDSWKSKKTETSRSKTSQGVRLVPPVHPLPFAPRFIGFNTSHTDGVRSGSELEW